MSVNQKSVSQNEFDKVALAVVVWERKHGREAAFVVAGCRGSEIKLLADLNSLNDSIHQIASKSCGLIQQYGVELVMTPTCQGGKMLPHAIREVWPPHLSPPVFIQAQTQRQIEEIEVSARQLVTAGLALHWLKAVPDSEVKGPNFAAFWRDEYRSLEQLRRMLGHFQKCLQRTAADFEEILSGLTELTPGLAAHAIRSALQVGTEIFPGNAVSIAIDVQAGGKKSSPFPDSSVTSAPLRETAEATSGEGNTFDVRAYQLRMLDFLQSAMAFAVSTDPAGVAPLAAQAQQTIDVLRKK